MSWAIGFDEKWKRDIGYGVPSICDHPDCNEKIDRGLAYVCGSQPYGGEHGCGLYFCTSHLQINEFEDDEAVSVCECCSEDKPPFEPTPDTQVWIIWKLTHESWEQWRKENPDQVKKYQAELDSIEE